MWAGQCHWIGLLSADVEIRGGKDGF